MGEAGTRAGVTVRTTPLLYLFGRRNAARVEVSGTDAATTAVRDARFGM